MSIINKFIYSVIPARTMHDKCVVRNAGIQKED
jgi:hypothetical protein